MSNGIGYVGRRLLFIGVFVGACLGISGVLAIIGFRWWWCSILAVVVLPAGVYFTNERRQLDPLTWLRGAEGESHVSRILRDLVPIGCRVIEHIDIGHGDVDHVVVGPTGVFAVETKNWPGRVEAHQGSLSKNGQPVPGSVRQTVRNAIAIRELVDVQWVEAILVCVAANVVGEPIRLPSMAVVSAGKLNGLITDRRDRLTPDEVERIAGTLRQIRERRDRAAAGSVRRSRRRLRRLVRG